MQMQRRCFLQHTIPWPAWASPIESGRASKKAQAQDGCDLKRVGEQVAQAVFRLEPKAFSLAGRAEGSSAAPTGRRLTRRGGPYSPCSRGADVSFFDELAGCEWVLVPALPRRDVLGSVCVSGPP
ncbi:hypothetical protein BKA63DRAFT_205120 [Paraphoma chrysanthemicola]|nr:hypothetical protein BKA63DRAFT_205120 [Paraphoma chrysanthemicola]